MSSGSAFKDLKVWPPISISTTAIPLFFHPHLHHLAFPGCNRRTWRIGQGGPEEPHPNVFSCTLSPMRKLDPDLGFT